MYQGESAVLPALYGGAVALANTLLLARRVEKAGELAEKHLNFTAYSLYFGMIQRFVFVLVALGVGLSVLELSPAPLLGTFMVAQLVYMLVGSRQKA